MSENRQNGSTEDWLSAPARGGRSKTAEPTDRPSTGHRSDEPTNGPSNGVGRGSGPGPVHGPIAEPGAASTVVGTVYPNGDAESPGLSAPYSAGPATSLGLGSARTGSSELPRAAASKPSASSRRPVRGPRRAKLQIRHIDPWSTLKLSLVLAIAFFFVWMVAVGVLYGVLNGMGVFDKINSLFSEISSSSGSTSSDIINTKIVFGGAAIIGMINVVLFTALATIGSYIYNLCADLVGGLEITLAERR